MEIGFVGLGRMGGNMSLRLLKKGHRVIGFDLSPAAVQSYAGQGTVPAKDWKDFVNQFKDRPRIMWIMVPAGDPTTQAINTLIELGDRDDIIIDGGNTNWKVALDDSKRVNAKGLHYVDAGVSGGIWGLEFGYSLMVGAEPDIYDHLLSILKDLARPLRSSRLPIGVATTKRLLKPRRATRRHGPQPGRRGRRIATPAAAPAGRSCRNRVRGCGCR
ncbi:MAG TPA: NAD(P)-binding domain-containing protein, partial [Candidatus Dormibacteraeota bacterium]|nr:NAD(P)-binding domain-containing protein [Candidatus Dormibacteraeota bacterium]